MRGSILALALMPVPLSASWSTASMPDLAGIQEVELSPRRPRGFALRDLSAGLSAPFRGRSYWYRSRVLELETVPADASVELMFLRAGLQLRYERLKPPGRVRLPSRVDTTSMDALLVRVSANGYTRRELAIRLDELPERLTVALDPLPNSLVFAGLSHVGGRSRLTLHTTEQASLRVLRHSGRSGFTVVLANTAADVSPFPRLVGDLVTGVELAQAGEDLLLWISTSQEPVEVRSRSRFDPVRSEHVLIVSLALPGHRPPSPADVQREIAEIGFDRDDRCAQRFEETLRSGLDPDVLARARRNSDALVDIYRREAMRSLGAAANGTVRSGSGPPLDTDDALELELALHSSLAIHGYLALLGAWAREQGSSPTALRSLVAPGLDPGAFDPIHREAESEWVQCLREKE